MQVRNIFCTVLACSILFAAAPVASAGSAADLDSAPARGNELSYAEYIKLHSDTGVSPQELRIPGNRGTASGGAETVKPNEWEGKSEVLVWNGETGDVTYSFDAPEAGYYGIDLEYFMLPGKGGYLELALQINGKTPFQGAEKFRFSRMWADDLAPGQPFAEDGAGNQIAPRQKEISGWQRAAFSDGEGFYSDPLRFYFEKGGNTLTLTCLREAFALSALILCGREAPGAYRAPADAPAEDVPTGYMQKIPAERAALKSDASLRADYDKADPLTEPSDPSKTLRNIIGGSRWASQGQWIEWTFSVPASGYYRLGMRYRQNTVRGFYTTRRILIDGKLPFAEMDAVRFGYGRDWSVKTLGDENPYLFYFEAGREHTIRMEVTTGEMGVILRELQQSQTALSGLYRRIIMITGKNPDLYRDYELEKEIPGLLDTMLTVSEALEQQARRIESGAGFSGSEAAILYRVSRQLASLVKDPYSIPQRLGSFGDNISSLAAWIMSVKGQPLELDYLAVMAPDAETPAAGGNFFQKLYFGLRSFLHSFTTDYNGFGTQAAGESAIEVWLGSGNEQMSILGQLVNSTFTSASNIPVRLKLVSSTLLVQAIMAGVGPDVAIGVARTEPVNLAMRGALEPLDGYGDFAEVTRRFMPSAMEPYLFYGKHYALPDSQVFNMMFYRTDIFAELGIKPPDTWDDLYAIAPLLQRNHMDVGMPMSAFNMLLLQNGGAYYNRDKTAMAFDTETAARSFVQWVEFYTQYGYPLFKDDYTRFRTGEMPVTMMPYTFYSQLVVAAPEIRGLWAMGPIPGVRTKDGGVIRTDSATGTAAILLKSGKHKEESWQFLNWWTSAQAQTDYCLELEAVMGMVARYPAATVEAFDRLPWTRAEHTLLTGQWKNVVELPELPGGYYVSRNLDNAFRAAVYRLENPQETLRYWTRETNKEIRRKLDEYHLGPQ